MYGNLTPDLACARFNDRLARTEAQRLAAEAKQAQPRRRRTSIPTVLRLFHRSLLIRRPAA